MCRQVVSESRMVCHLGAIREKLSAPYTEEELAGKAKDVDLCPFCVARPFWMKVSYTPVNSDVYRDVTS